MPPTGRRRFEPPAAETSSPAASSGRAKRGATFLVARPPAASDPVSPARGLPMDSPELSQPKADGNVSRRNLLDALLAAGACVWAAGIAVPTAIYLWPARASGPGEGRVKAGSIKDFPVGSARMLQHRGKPL